MGILDEMAENAGKEIDKIKAKSEQAVADKKEEVKKESENETAQT